VRDTEDFKFNVTLVLIDLFLRLDLLDAIERPGCAARSTRPVPSDRDHPLPGIF